MKRARNPQILDNERVTNGSKSGLFFENERNGIDTPALVSGDVKALALEDMTQV
jgi:hypothetical protein